MSSGRNKVTAILVTFNRKHLVKNCLNSLLEQSKCLDEIIIVDNNSSDGTKDELISSKYISNNFSKLENGSLQSLILKKMKNLNSECKINYHLLESNIGGAGGFNYGMELAIKNGNDFIWMMDDDGHASQRCLETLINSIKSSKLDFINPLVINEKNYKKLSFKLGNTSDVSQIKKLADNQGIIKYDVNPFNGTLFYRSAAIRNGAIKKEMFIWGDEVEYTLRAKKNGLAYGTCVNSSFFHPEDKSNFKKFLFMEIIIKPQRLEMNYYRNRGFINLRYLKLNSHILIVKVFLYYLFSLNLYRATLSLAYYLDGLFNLYKLKPIR